MSDINNNNEAQSTIKDQIQPYLKVWPWILLSIILCIIGAATYLRYATSSYQAQASIIIKDTQSGGGVSELGALGDIGGLLGNNFNSVENEIEVLKSKLLIARVVDELNLQTTYSREGNIKTSNIYTKTPIFVETIDSENHELKKTISFILRYRNDSLFEFKSTKDAQWNSIAYGKSFQVNDIHLIGFPNAKAIERIESLKSVENKKDFPVIVTVLPKERMVLSIASRLNVSASGRRGSVVSLSITDAVGEKAEDILNQLIAEYNKDAIRDKNLVAQKTLEFIEDRLEDYEKELDSVEVDIQGFKDDIRVTDLQAETALDLQRNELLNEKIVGIETQLRLSKDMKSYLSTSLNNGSAVSMAGLSDLKVDGLLASYNELAAKYRRYAETSTPSNPVLQTLGAEIEDVKVAITSSLNNYISSLELQKQKVQQQINATGVDIKKVPVRERISRNIDRNRQVVEAIYLILREKQETTAISLAVTAPKAKVVDSGYAQDLPVSPKPKIIVLTALILGLLLPIAVVYLKTLFYNKIESRKDLEKSLPQLAILGEIPRLDRNDKDFIEKNDRSVLAESFRILRTNLYYKLNTVQVENRRSKVVMVTSTIQGEGKTFVAYNLSLTLASPNTKVLLLGADIRNPQLHRYLDRSAKRAKGLTEFLVDDSINGKELTYTSEINPDLDILLSGAIPPNPAELLMQDRMGDVFEDLYEEYDIIVVDTAPTLLVTDTFLINKYSDMTVFVSRANHTERSLLDFISDNHKGDKLHNIALVLNNVKLTNFGYGNKYGYAYGKKKDSFWKKALKKLTGRK